MLFTLFYFCSLFLTMCLHPRLDCKLSSLWEKYENTPLDEFDNCDYVDHVTNVNTNDIAVMHLNIRGRLYRFQKNTTSGSN